jgi:sugar lactone lactonase YvrE
MIAHHRLQIAVLALTCLSSGLMGRLCQGQEMQYPLAVVKAANETIYVADRNMPGIWKFEGGQLSVYFEGSKRFRTPLNAVRCLALDAQGNLYAGDTSTREIYRFDAEGQPEPLTKGQTGIPMGIVFDSNGKMFVADLERQAILQVSASGEVTEFVSIQGPRGIAIDKQDRIWVLTNTGDALVRFGPDKSKEVLIAGTPFEFANQLVLDESENAYLCDGYAKAVIFVPRDGSPQKLASGEPLKHPVGITLASEVLLIADPHAKAIFSLSKDGSGVLETVIE